MTSKSEYELNEIRVPKKLRIKIRVQFQVIESANNKYDYNFFLYLTQNS